MMEEKNSFVYFVLAQSTGLVKIGKSRTPKSRIAALQTASPDGLMLLKEIPEGHHGCTESTLHRRFAGLRVRGEWFRYEGALKSFIEGTAAEAPKAPSNVLGTVDDFAAIVRRRRQQIGWSQQGLAAATGVSRKWIVELERGKLSVEFGLVLKVMRKLGIVLSEASQPSVGSEERMEIAALMSKL